MALSLVRGGCRLVRGLPHHYRSRPSVVVHGIWSDKLLRWSSGENVVAADAQPPSAPSENAATTQAMEQLKAQLQEKDKAVEELNGQILDLEDKYKRSIAEMENVRQRMFKQIEEAKTFGIQSFSKDLLEVADVLKMAVDSAPKASGVSEVDVNKVLFNLIEGLQLTEAQLMAVFKRHGLEQVCPSVGEDFDPNIHEALFQVAGGDVGQVAELSQTGYTLNGRTIRAAKVGVFK